MSQTKRKTNPPTAQTDLAEMPAVDIAKRVRAGDLSAVDVLDQFVARIDRHNDQLNALVAERIAAAREEAEVIDERVRQGEDIGPLAGVPFTTKEMASAKGLPVTAGSLRRRDAVSDRDATFVRRARDGGGVLLGVTNQSELGLWWESVNPVYGRTRNPYDHARTSGGSSGGEGALVGGGHIGFGIGSDMGGSIRLPAYFCGVFGHKPTGNFVPTSGHFPLDYSDHRLANPPSTQYVSIGPLSRHARDLMPVLRQIAGACPDDPYAIDPDLTDPEPIAGRTVYFLEDPGMKLASSTHDAQRDAVRRAVRALRARGADVRPWEGPSLRHAMQIYTSMLAEIEDGVGLETLLGGDESVSWLREASRLVRGKGSHTAHALLVTLGERLVKPSPKAIEKMSTYGRQLRDDIDAYLGEDGLLLLPTFPRLAPKHGHTLVRPFDVAYTAIFNVTENPVTAVPTGLWHGLPTGVQIVGRRGNDHLSISAAIELDDAGFGWSPPSAVPRTRGGR